MTMKKKVIICVVSWIVVGIVSLLVLLDGALSHSEAKKDRANIIIIALMAANVGLNTLVFRTGKGDR